MFDLTSKERKEYCIELAKHLPRLRDLLHLSQKEFGAMCGVSKERLSRIECGHFVMTWSQLTSVLFVSIVNKATKEYLYANRVLDPYFLQFFQQKAPNIPPDTNICVHPGIIMPYSEMLDVNRHHIEKIKPPVFAEPEKKKRGRKKKTV